MQEDYPIYYEEHATIEEENILSPSHPHNL